MNLYLAKKDHVSNVNSKMPSLDQVGLSYVCNLCTYATYAAYVCMFMRALVCVCIHTKSGGLDDYFLSTNVPL